MYWGSTVVCIFLFQTGCFIYCVFLLIKYLWCLTFLPECAFAACFESIIKLLSRSDLLLGQANTRAHWKPYAKFNLMTQCAQLIHRDFCASCRPILPSSWSTRFVSWSVPSLNLGIFFVNLTAYSEMITISLCVSCCHLFRLICQIFFWSEKEVHTISSLCVWESPKQEYMSSSSECSAWTIPVGFWVGSPLKGGCRVKSMGCICDLGRANWYSRGRLWSERTLLYIAWEPYAFLITHI